MPSTSISPALAARLLAERELRRSEAMRPALWIEAPPEMEPFWQAPEPTRRPVALVLGADGEFTEIED